MEHLTRAQKTRIVTLIVMSILVYVSFSVANMMLKNRNAENQPTPSISVSAPATAPAP